MIFLSSKLADHPKRCRISKNGILFDIQRRVGSLELCGVNAVSNCLQVAVTVEMMNTAIDVAAEKNKKRYKPGAVIPRGVRDFGNCTIFEIQCLLRPLGYGWEEWKQSCTFDRIVEHCMAGLFIVYGWNRTDIDVSAHYLAIREGFVITDYVYKGNGGAGTVEPLSRKFLFGAKTSMLVFYVQKRKKCV